MHINRLIFTVVAVLTGLLLLLSSSTPSAASKALTGNLTASQKAAVNKIISQLVTTEEFAKPPIMVDFYQDRLNTVSEGAAPVIKKLPASELKTCLQYALQTHQDLITVLTETNKYPYYDLIADKQTPKIIAKFSLPVDLHSPEPFGRLEQTKVDFLIKALGEIAVQFRVQAQSDLK